MPRWGKFFHLRSRGANAGSARCPRARDPPGSHPEGAAAAAGRDAPGRGREGGQGRDGPGAGGRGCTQGDSAGRRLPAPRDATPHDTTRDTPRRAMPPPAFPHRSPYFPRGRRGTAAPAPSIPRPAGGCARTHHDAGACGRHGARPRRRRLRATRSGGSGRWSHRSGGGSGRWEQEAPRPQRPRRRLRALSAPRPQHGRGGAALSPAVLRPRARGAA